MAAENTCSRGFNNSETPSTNIDRRTLLGIGATAAGFGLNFPSARAATTASNPSMRVDAYTHFSSSKFFEFTEQQRAGNPLLASVYSHLPTLLDPTERLKLLDRNEIDMHVLVPVPWLEAFPVIANDSKLAPQAARLMNDELAAFMSTQPKRFRGVALLPTVDQDAMLGELHRAVKELGFIGAYLPVGPTAKRMDHSDFEPLYKAIVDLDVALWLHPSRPPMPEYVDEKASRYFEWQIEGWLSDTTSAMFRIVFAGVFDRYPDIRIVTHHAGGILPTSAMRADAMWTLFESSGPALPTKVSKPYINHFKKFYCDTAAFGYAPKVIDLALDFFGPDRVLFGTDTPFDATGGQYFTQETLRALSDIEMPPQTRTALLGGNARRILKLG
jgi:predicted TIM-barrel fold metal-dependent hydrolase